MLVDVISFVEDANLCNIKLWPKQKEILQQMWEPAHQISILCLGRRSGKTLLSALSGCYAACVMAPIYKEMLRPNEPFFIISVANSQDQARIALSNVKDIILSSPILKRLVTRETADELQLSTGAIFRCLSTSSRSGRGLAAPVAIFDELGHAADTEGNSAGQQLFNALTPSTAQFGGKGKVFVLSSPWLQQGVLWDLFKQGSSGKFDHMFVANFPTWEVNPSVSQEWLDQEKARDPEMFAVEFGANFSHSLAAFIDPELVDLAVNKNRGILPPLPDFQGKYYCSIDPAKGGRDAYVAVIGHMDGKRLVIDKWHEFRPSFENGKKSQISVSEVEEWLIEHHTLYWFKRVCLDQYNSVSTIQRLKSKMAIQELTWSVPTKTKAFSKLRQMFNSHNVELYPHEKSIQELKNLIVNYHSSGSWTVTGGSGVAVDDFAMALGGVVLLAEETTPHWLSIYAMH